MKVAKSDVDGIIEQAKADKKAASPSTMLKIFLAEDERSVAEIVSEMRRLQLSRGLDQTQKIKVLLDALIDTNAPKKVPALFKGNTEILGEVAHDAHSGNLLICCIEELLGVTAPQCIKCMPHVLQTLYEADVLEEGTILTWADSPPESSWLVSKDVAITTRKSASPFIQWLRDADEESDEEDEDE